MDKYIWVQELIFHLSRDVSLGCLCSNFLMASATTTLINLTPAPRARKIVCKHVIFFDHGWAGYLTYQGVPHLHVNRPSITVTVVEIYNSNRAKQRMYTRGSCTSEYFLATTTCFEYLMCAKILFSSRSRIYNKIYSYMYFALKLCQWDRL